ncbi:TNT domain-containing protein [Curtobacterium sp. Leaf261]|uniref:TNT domain-containing protein n=1 Tax=Curtobacterium sp. Leaf261 TaxID=1736311 RepID=UPI0012E2A40E|nr:TNT domain-containing protein [Curtobacterium sp. Leaf261]
MVNTGAIPYTDVDLGGVSAGASSLRTVASGVRDGTADVVTAWTPISGVYEGPGDQDLYDAMTPIGPQGTSFGDNLDIVAKALDDFVTEVTPIVAKLKSYVTRATQLHADVANFSPETTQTMDGPVTTTESWDQDETLNGENNDIINGVANQVVAYQAAERTCSNTIRAISCLPPLHAITGDDDPLGYGYSELPMGTKLPWGTAEARKESCAEKTGMFVPNLLKGVVVDGIWGTVKGLGQLVGITGKGFGDWDAAGQAWSGMGSLISYNPQTGKWGDWGNAGATWTALGKDTIAWDEWSKDPGTAAGQTVWNIGSLFLGGVGAVGKAGKLGKVGEVVAEGAAKTGRVLDLLDLGTWVSKGLHLVLPKLSEIESAIGAAVKSGFHFTMDHMPHFKSGEFHFNSHAHTDVDVPPVRDDAGTGSHAPVQEPVTVTHGGGSEHGGSEHGGSGSGSDHGGSGSGSEHGGSGNASDHGDGSTDGNGNVSDHGDGPSDGHDGNTGDDANGGNHAGSGAGGTGGHTAFGDEHSGPGGGPLHDDPTQSTADHGPGWDKTHGVRGDPLLPTYGDVQPDSSVLGAAYRAPGDSTLTGAGVDDMNPMARELLTSDPGPDGYYGHDVHDGHALTRQEWEERYVVQDPKDPTRGWVRYPGDAGAALGERIDFTDPTRFGEHYSTTIDRFGGENGSFLSFPGTSFEERAIAPGSLRQDYHQYSIDLDAAKANGWTIEVSRVAPALGQPGGGLQVRLLDGVKPLSVEDMLRPGLGKTPALRSVLVVK